MKTQIEVDEKGNTIISSKIHLFTEDGEVILISVRIISQTEKAIASFDIINAAKSLCERELREEYNRKKRGFENET